MVNYPRLIDRLSALTDQVNAGKAGLPTLDRLLTLGQEALDADGASFTEHAPLGGRIIAATGAAEWALGHPAESIVDGPGPVERAAADLTGTLAGQFSARGLHRVLAARAELSGVAVGSLHAYYADPAGPADAEQRRLAGWLASWAAHLYGDHNGLPVHGDGWVVKFRDLNGALRRERDRDLFVAVTSHELRTPVTVIKGYADTLGEHWDSLGDAQRREAVQVLSQRSGDLARLVDRLLAGAGHTGSTAGSAIPVPFDLVEALRSAVRALPADLRRRLQVTLPTVLPKANGDRTSIATLLTELVTNADKYSPAGAEVALDAAADSHTVFFRVSDRGMGVPPQHVERAFERFWQGEVDAQCRHGGVGLGLYLVRRLVERQNGWVSLRRREAGGTVAEVRLPRADLAPREE